MAAHVEKVNVLHSKANVPVLIKKKRWELYILCDHIDSVSKLLMFINFFCLIFFFLSFYKIIYERRKV